MLGIGLLFMAWIGILYSIFIYWKETQYGYDMGSAIAVSQSWFVVSLLIGLGVAFLPSLSWGWGVAAFVAGYLLDIPTKMLLWQLFDRIRLEKPVE